MSGTPRLRSAYPSTPPSIQKSEGQNAALSSDRDAKVPLPSVTASSADSNVPVIPVDIVDAPSQRLYATAIYIGLILWRCHDYWKLLSNESDSLPLFLKWVIIDGVFLFGLPALKIPWLEWSSSTMTALFLVHAFVDGLLMFKISVPFEGWLVTIAKVMYDRELSVSERRVKPGNIIHNSSLILGKQIIHILPEGFVMLNPDQKPLCLDSVRGSIQLPIRLNQTNPILIDLLRFDLETNLNETITISAKELRRMKKQADKGHGRNDQSTPRLLSWSAKKTGMYRLRKVIDESKLEVQRVSSDTLIVECPRASVRSGPANKCKGELSNLVLEVDGTPPLKIKYSKLINKEDHAVQFQTLQPENFVSPLVRQSSSGSLIQPESIDVAWARSQRVDVPLNETLTTVGGWLYSIDEVHDACGNVVNYTQGNELGERPTSRAAHLEQGFIVHERPRAVLEGCDPQNPLKIADMESTVLPVRLRSAGQPQTVDNPHTLSYIFTPQSKLQPNGEHAVDASTEVVTIRNMHQRPRIHSPGLYSLKTVSSAFCAGEILEPASCVLVNPPEPDLSVTAEKIYDKCAGSSIGLLVDLDLIGTPPFQVQYTARREGGTVVPELVTVERLRGQLELKPQDAGHYTYEFLSVGDAVYVGRSMRHKNLVLEQDVKPPASARFVDVRPKRRACIEEPVSLDVQLLGEGPWALEYELVHGDKRHKHKIQDIQNTHYTIITDPLLDGGEYSLALVSITDRSGCKTFLDQDVKIEVRWQRPKAAFGQLEGQRTMLTLEGKKVKLPLRLTGEAPWKIVYQNCHEPSASSCEQIREERLQYPNDVLEVIRPGAYQIVEVHDAVCPGSVDRGASTFEVGWIPRPQIKIVDKAVVEHAGDQYFKDEVCEGSEDALELALSGSPPYHVKYEQRLRPERGSVSLSKKEFTAGLGAASIRMETGQAGVYEYRFSELSDHLYDHDPRRLPPLVVQQKVNPKPSAQFSDTGKTYGFCKDEDFTDEIIPMTLTGIAPFYLEVAIKQHAVLKPEILSIPLVESKSYNLHIPRRVLALGSHTVSIRKVRDSRGCERYYGGDGPHVQVNVADIPAIAPLETQSDYCVGDRISYTLSGTPPFNIFYTFENAERKATVTTTNFRRIAEKPGNFTITAISDGASGICKARTDITKIIHEMPSVKVSKGKTVVIDLHEGGETQILFEFGGTPPFEFTYTRSTNAQKGKRSSVIETKHETSSEYSKVVKASDEGTYEVVAIRDRYCAFSTQRVQGRTGQALLQYR